MAHLSFVSINKEVKTSTPTTRNVKFNFSKNKYEKQIMLSYK